MWVVRIYPIVVKIDTLGVVLKVSQTYMYGVLVVRCVCVGMYVGSLWSVSTNGVYV